MIVTLKTQGLQTPEQVHALLAGSAPLSFARRSVKLLMASSLRSSACSTIGVWARPTRSWFGYQKLPLVQIANARE